MTEQEEQLKDEVREELTKLAEMAYYRGYVDGQAAAERELDELSKAIKPHPK